MLSPPTLFPAEELPSMQSPAASPARTSRALESALACRVRDLVCGRNTRDLLASFDPASLSWRTSQTCALEGLATFSETWPRSGMMLCGKASPLPPLVRLTDETGSGSLPTPTVGDSKSARNSTAKRNKIPPTGIHAGDTLTDWVTKWPTPTAKLGDPRRGMPSQKLATSRFESGRRNLEDAVAMWPTPTANRRSGLQSHGRNAILGALNPMWVEWLLGFPAMWTDCGPSETRSSRKSRS